MRYDEIEIGGEKWPIAYPIAAIQRLADEAGKDPFAALGQIESGADFTLMVSFVRVGLESGAKRAKTTFALTNGELAEMLEVRDFVAVGEILKKYLPTVDAAGEVVAATKNA